MTAYALARRWGARWVDLASRRLPENRRSGPTWLLRGLAQAGLALAGLAQGLGAARWRCQLLQPIRPRAIWGRSGGDLGVIWVAIWPANHCGYRGLRQGALALARISHRSCWRRAPANACLPRGIHLDFFNSI